MAPQDADRARVRLTVFLLTEFGAEPVCASMWSEVVVALLRPENRHHLLVGLGGWLDRTEAALAHEVEVWRLPGGPS